MSRKKLSSNALAYELDTAQESRSMHRNRGGAKKFAHSKTNVVKLNSYAPQQKTHRRPVELIPKSIRQEEYVDMLLDSTKTVVFSTGPAGTGKTMLAVLAALKAYKEGSVEKIVITRPSVGADDEKLGFLPGDINEKMAPWTRPIFDVIKEYYSPREVAKMVEDEVIEVAPLAFLRGRTFKNAWIVADEMQNSTTNQMKMLLTRIGDNSKMAVTGDLNQNDRKYAAENGLREFIALVQKRGSSSIGTVNFENKDIMRHPIVQEVLEIYGEA